MRVLPGFALLVLTAVPASAQTTAYQSEKRVQLKLDALLRREWTQDIFQAADVFRDESRWRGRVLPRLEIAAGRLELGVGGDFNWSSDDNVAGPPALIRDNYRSDDSRLDLAYARLQPAGWLRLQGGRIPMPIALTEMIWDRDLRPQGGAVTLEARDLGSLSRLGATVLGARGSHVFEDEDTNMVALSGEAVLATSPESRLELVGSYLKFTRLDSLEPMIRRQNTRLAGALVNEYRVADFVARYVVDSGGVPLQLVADYCWNTALDEDNRGLWLAAVLGSIRSSRARAEYTYAKVDKDATLAAYASDDFFWATGWEGHRGELATRLGEHLSSHVIGQLQRFKDSPRPEEQEHWVKRLRLELRLSY
jgi:hypothetical protein